MKRIVPFVIVAAALFAVPALPQASESGGEDPATAEILDRIEELAAENAAQAESIDALTARLDAQQAEAKRLLGTLHKAETQGFAAAAPNVPARQALLDGLKRFANVAAGKEPDAPSPSEDE